MKHIIFDLDGTLINTSRLKEYMRNKQGREYVINNLARFNLQYCNHYIPQLLNSIKNYCRISIVTNSPQEYVQKFAEIYHFPQDTIIIGNAKKPNSDSLIEAIRKNSSGSSLETILIGDSPTDILAAHNVSIPSFGVSWGEFEIQKIASAEPIGIISNETDLHDIVDYFFNNRIDYEPRKDPANWIQYPAERLFFSESLPNRIQIENVGNYCKYELLKSIKDSETSRNSKNILCYKRCKEEKLVEIENGKCDRYFYNGVLNNGSRYKTVIEHFKKKIEDKIGQLNLQGKTLILGAPNSNPEYCYNTDINAVLANKIATTFQFYRCENRVISRIRPKSEAHSGGERNIFSHLRTMGTKNINYNEFNNILFLDDVTTSGRQFRALEILLRQCQYQGKVYGIALGKNIEA